MAKKELKYNNWNQIVFLGDNVKVPEQGGLYTSLKLNKKREPEKPFGIYGIVKLKEGSVTDIEESYNLTLPEQWAKGGTLNLDKKRVTLFPITARDLAFYKAHTGSMASNALGEKVRMLEAELAFEKTVSDHLTQENRKMHVENTNLYTTLNLIPRWIKWIFAV